MPGAKTASAAICLIAISAGRVLAADFVAEPIASAVQLVQPALVPDFGATAQAMISEEGSFDSNPLLQTGGARPLYGSITTPELILRDATPAYQLNSDTLINANAFNRTDFNSVDVHSTDGFLGTGERWSAGVEGKVDFDTTRTSELTNFDLTTHPFRHTGLEADPEVSYTPTAIDKVTLAGSYADSQYQNPVFSNFEIYGLTSAYVHNLDPRNAAVVTVQAQHYETTNNARNTTDSVGPSLGWISALTPEIAAKITFGGETVRQTQAGGPSSGWKAQYIFSGDLTFKGQRSVAELLASRAEYPFGNGSEALLTSLQANDTYKLNQVIALTVGAGYDLSDYQVTQTGDLKSDWTGNVGFTYAVNDQIDVKTLYQFKYETLENIQPHAEEHVITVSLKYRLDPQSL